MPDQGSPAPWLTYADLDRRARAIAAELQARGAAGERALLIYPSGLEFVAAFFGCLYAGAVAVPSYPPRRNRLDARLTAIVRDCGPQLVLASSAIVEKRQSYAAHNPVLQGLEWLATDSIADERAGEWRDPGVTGDTLAFLQYTSGSTSSPKGVMVSHGNLLHNEEAIRLAFAQSAESVVVGWLPLYHDMGLIGNILQPLYAGAPCVLMSPVSFLQRPVRWLEAISRYRGTTSGGPSFAYDLCVQKIRPEERAGLDLSCWKLAFNGAEPVRAETLERFAETFASCGFRREAFYPCYGLAEATLFVSGGLAAEAPVIGSFEGPALERDQVRMAAPSDPLRRALVGCGSAWDGHEIRIADPEKLSPRAEGQVGEIWFAGPSVAQGYWNRPEDTARLFRARLAGHSGEFLRTGDLGFVSGGELYVTGRLKDLIILRGRNLYPQDIEETVERSHLALRPGCGIAFGHEVEGEERLVVVQEVEHRPGVPFETLASEVFRAVAEEHDLQVHRLVLLRAGSLPKTTSGKVRRQACRTAWLAGELGALWEGAPGGGGAVDEIGPASPAFGRETSAAASRGERRLLEELRRRIAGILRVAPERLEPGRSLAEAGIDSLHAIEIKRLLEEDFGYAVDLADLLPPGSLEELAEQILRADAATPVLSRVEPGGEVPEHPLSFGQSSLWFLHRLSPESAAYNLAAAARIRGAVDVAALRRAFTALVERHASLRSIVVEEHGRPRVRLHPGWDVLVVEDSAAWSEGDLDERLDDEAHRPFALTEGPLLRVHLFPRPDGEHVLLFVVHHFAVDFWSLALVADELGALYTAFASGETESPLPPLRYTYSDFVRWQEAEVAGAAGERSWEYWRDQLTPPVPELQLPADRPRPRRQSFEGAGVFRAAPADLRARLEEIARREGATLSMVLLSAFQTLLLRHGSQQDLAIGTPAAGRTSSAFDEVVGYFVNPMVLRGDLSGDPGFGELVRRTRQRVLEGLAHQGYPFALLAERLQPQRDAGLSPLFQALFVFHSNRAEAEGLAGLALRRRGGKLALGELSLESVGLVQRTALFDLTLTAAELDGGLGLALEYRTDLFDPATVARLAERLAVLLAGVAASPVVRLSELPLLGEPERHQVLVEWSGAALPEPPSGGPRNLRERFAAQASRTPERVALVWEEERWTYAELAARAEALARTLAGLGVRPEIAVGLLLERTPEMVVGMLGILGAGGAYLPLDPAYPRERLALMVEDAGADLVLTRRNLVDRLEGLPVRPLCLDEAWPEPGRIAASPGAGALAYLIYTSGSTGRPKGVAIEHRSAAALLDWAREAFSAAELSGVLASTSINFDLSVFELFTPLTSGGTVILARDALALPSLPAAGEVTLVNTVPSALSALLRDGGLPPSVRTVNLAGERLPGDLVRRTYERTGAERVLNLYGPSEDTTYSTLCVVDRGETGEPGIGHPVPGSRAYVLDGSLGPVPPGVAGELYLAGAGLARGYLGRPEVTAERFVPEPFSGEPGGRMYRTGDVVRQRGDGSLDFRGRADHQVKVRGFRIELGEIEAALRREPSVREAVVVAREVSPGERRLVAYVASSAVPLPTPGGLRSFLKRSLPEPMVPAAFVVLPELPLNANGKVDRKALPEPEDLRSARERTAPRGLTEELLAVIWGEVLRVRDVGVEESFFELGGHSLLATQVVSRIRETFGVEIPLRALFDAPTVADLAALLDSVVRAGATSEVPALRKLPRTDRMPLSFAQQRLWFLEQWQPSGAAYNLAGALRIRGRLRVEVLAGALMEIVRRHESLRTTFLVSDGEPAQSIHPASPPNLLPVVDLGALPEPVREREMKRLAEQDARRGFDLERGPLFRSTLVRFEREDDHALLAVMHHIVSDAWSMSILMRELEVLYRAGLEGTPSPLPEPPVQYADFSGWQRQWLAGPRLQAELEHWRARLAGAPLILELPADRPRPPAQSFRGATCSFELSERLAASGEALGRREGATPFMVLLTAFQALLARYTGREDVSVGTPIAGRNRLETEGLIGFFVNTLVLRTGLAGDPSFRGLLARVRGTALEAHAHQDLPFEKLVDELAPERSLSHSPLVQVVFVLQNAPLELPELPGMELCLLESRTGTAKFDLTLELTPAAGGLRCTVEYATDLFDAATVVRLSRHFETLLEGATSEPDRRLSELPLLTDSEQRNLLASPGVRPVSRESRCLHEIFAARATAQPESVALRWEGEEMTYAGLDRRANALAWRLRASGVGPETRVAVFLERSPDLVVGILAVLKAGGAYVPLDPSYPRERLTYLLEDSGAPVLLTGCALVERLPVHGAELVVLDELPQESGERGPESRTDPGNAAYVIYTSGSTGRPKGVVVTHANVSRLLAETERWFAFGPKDIWTLFHSYAFDFSVWEIWGALLSGGRLVVVPYLTSRSPEAFLELLVRERVTVLNQTPSAFRQLVAAEGERPESPDLSLRWVLFGGEALDLPSLGPWFDRHGDETPRLVNLYGITETTVHVTYRPLSASEARQASGSPIGRPIPDLRLFLLDRWGQPVPAGVPGELFVGGAGLARGYHLRPDLTAARFLPDPFGGEAGARLYRSGDLARLLPDGDLEYLGRIDQQVKLRGFRIELGEIEAALGRHPGVRDSVVLLREDAPGDKRLVGYVTARPGSSLTASGLRGFLKEELPEHMVPAALVMLAAFPLTPHGKLDRRALPVPERSAAQEEPEGGGLRTPVEQIVAGIWCEVLGLPRVGAADNFFELGGSSLLATQLISRTRRTLGVDVSLRTLFEAPTVAELAAECERARRGDEASAPPLVPTPCDGALPLSFAQQRLWFLDQWEPGRPIYNISAALRIVGPFRPDILERALTEVVRRHESLRTTFDSVAGEPVQNIGPATACSVPLVDLAGLEAQAGLAEARRLAREEALRPFDLRRGPLLRMTLVRLGGQDHVSLVDLHHIVSDGWSMSLLVREIAILHDAFLEGRPSPLPDLPVQYADYARWQRGWLRGEILAAQTAFWKRRLAGVPPLIRLRSDRPRPQVQSFRGGSRPFVLPESLVRSVQELGRREGATVFMILLAAYQILLRQITEQEDFVIGSPSAGRHHLETEKLIGFFTNLLPLRADLAGNPSFQELLGRVRETVLEAHAHQDLPFEKLIEELRLDRDLGHNPLVQVAFTLVEAPEIRKAFPGAALHPFEIELETTQFDLTLSLREDGGGLAGFLQYSADLFEASTVKRLVDQYVLLLTHAVGHPGCTMADLNEIVKEADTQQRIARSRERKEDFRNQLAGVRRTARRVPVPEEAP